MKVGASVGVVWLALFAVLVAGCAKKAPDWVNKISYIKDNKIYAVGAADKTPSVHMTRVKCETRARAELAKAIKSHVESLVKDFIEHHRDYFNDDAEGLDEFTQMVVRNVVQATLHFSVVDATWESDDVMYCRAYIPLDTEFYRRQYEEIKRLIRERHRAVVAERAEEALRALDRELEKRTKTQK